MKNKIDNGAYKKCFYCKQGTDYKTRNAEI